MQPSAKAENIAILQIDVARMKIGEVKLVSGYYYLYKEGENKYFLMNGWAPHRKCDIKFIEAGMSSYVWEERKIYNSKPHFYEPCDGGIWELSGKYVLGTGHPKERDMEQRKFKISSDGSILFHRGQS